MEDNYLFDGNAAFRIFCVAVSGYNNGENGEFQSQFCKVGRFIL